ncbi:MAG: hypothetical protein AAGJ10_17815, partial [Bacteroidota bacterium]
GSPEAQLGAYQRDFTDIHNAAGLYILPYHFEIQGLTPERADVLAALGRYADRSGSWVTTLAEIHDWWTKRAQLEVRIGARSERATAFEVINRTGENLTGVSIDVRLAGPVDGFVDLDGGQGEILVSPDGRTLTLVLSNVRPGVNRLRLANYGE